MEVDGDCIKSCMLLVGIMTGCLKVDCGELDEALSFICDNLTISFNCDSGPTVVWLMYAFDEGVDGIPWFIIEFP